MREQTGASSPAGHAKNAASLSQNVPSVEMPSSEAMSADAPVAPASFLDFPRRQAEAEAEFTTPAVQSTQTPSASSQVCRIYSGVLLQAAVRLSR